MKHKAVLIPGDGIGPEIARVAQQAIEATGAQIEWTVAEAGAAQIGKCGCALPPETIERVRQAGVALKGPIATPVGKGFRSVNVVMRRELDLYANVRPAISFAGVKSRYEGVDLVVVRENTEGLYAGVEHNVGKDAAESIKIITRPGCERIVQYAFDYARKNGRKKVTAVHKANIMKCTDGMFLDIARQIAGQYPQVEFEEMIVDAACMRLVMNPADFDVMVMPNLYGDIVSDLCAGLVGGPGLAPSANIGRETAIFEAVHGSAPQLAGRDIASPVALTLSAAMLLRHLGEGRRAALIEAAVAAMLRSGETTPDLGGALGTRAFGERLCQRILASQ